MSSVYYTATTLDGYLADEQADSLWGSTDDHLRHSVLLLRIVPIGTARWAVLLRAGQSPFEPRLVTVPDGLQTGREPHPRTGGQPLEEPSAGHLDRVRPDVDPVGNRLAAAQDAVLRPPRGGLGSRSDPVQLRHREQIVPLAPGSQTAVAPCPGWAFQPRSVTVRADAVSRRVPPKCHLA